MKQSLNTILDSVVEKFPHQANHLNKLFQKDENFREICEDYVLCLNAMEKIIITNKRKSKIIKEYKKALKELELELLKYLHNSASVRK